MKTAMENVRIVTNDSGGVVAVIRRDSTTKKSMIHLLLDASVDQIGALIENRTDVEDMQPVAEPLG